MSEWFYINMWKQNKLKVWIVIDELGNNLTEPMSRNEAIEYIFKSGNKNHD